MAEDYSLRYFDFNQLLYHQLLYVIDRSFQLKVPQVTIPYSHFDANAPYIVLECQLHQFYGVFLLMEQVLSLPSTNEQYFPFFLQNDIKIKRMKIFT